MDIMAEAEVECQDCHLGDNKQIYRPDKGKCAECHDEDYAEMHTEWQNSVKESISALTDSLKKKKNLTLTPQENSILREVERELQRIKLDGSMGIHNYMFFEETLADLKKKVGSK